MELCTLLQRSIFFHTLINNEPILGHRILEVALWLHMLLSSIKITSVLATSQQIKFDENSSVCKVEMPNNGQINVSLLHPLNISNCKKQNQQWYLPKLQLTYKECTPLQWNSKHYQIIANKFPHVLHDLSLQLHLVLKHYTVHFS